MAFLDNVIDIFGIDIDELSHSAVVTLYVGKGVHIEGKVKVNSFSAQEISISTNKRVYVLVGEGLSIYEISQYDIYVLGEVREIRKV